MKEPLTRFSAWRGRKPFVCLRRLACGLGIANTGLCSVHDISAPMASISGATVHRVRRGCSSRGTSRQFDKSQCIELNLPISRQNPAKLCTTYNLIPKLRNTAQFDGGSRIDRVGMPTQTVTPKERRSTARPPHRAPSPGPQRAPPRPGRKGYLRYVPGLLSTCTLHRARVQVRYCTSPRLRLTSTPSGLHVDTTGIITTQSSPSILIVSM